LEAELVAVGRRCWNRSSVDPLAERRRGCRSAKAATNNRMRGPAHCADLVLALIIETCEAHSHYPSILCFRRLMRTRIALLLTVTALGSMMAVVCAQKSVPLRTLPFSPARKAGPTLYVSGQVPRTPEGQDVRQSVEAETKQVMDNIGAVLKEHGYTFDDVVNATVYLKDINDYAEMNKIYASYFKKGFPARATVGGVEIVFGFRVEISCIAYKEKP
jgi:2-iminobutanoate/2-iminopropanoate deaminase